jgi:hypothetical protein
MLPEKKVLAVCGGKRSLEVSCRGVSITTPRARTFTCNDGLRPKGSEP